MQVNSSEMSFLKSLTFILLLATKTGAFEVKDMLCNEDFCTQYIEKNGCPVLSDACLAQNSTRNGVYLPFPDVCNCCDYCLTNLAKGDACTRGIAGMMPPTMICGPGLACTASPNKGEPATCQTMVQTGCTAARKDYDDRRAAGTTGMFEVRPKCDDDGRYAPAHCIPGSICYCVDTEGNRIFGETPFLSSWDENRMTCGCSINAWKAQSLVDPEFLKVMFTARCNDQGLYDPLQCMMGRKGNCLCVDPLTGEPKKDTLVVPVGNLTKGRPACFDPSVHSIGVYETQCEIEKMKWNEVASTTTEASIRQEAFEDPQCQPDGKYHRVQTLGTKKICVDPSGKQIETFEADVQSASATAMNCNCARTQWLLEKAGLSELPSCCSNGNFEAWQCRRNECFCVNQNGDQIEVEVHVDDISKLSCYTDGACPAIAT